MKQNKKGFKDYEIIVNEIEDPVKFEEEVRAYLK